MSSDVFMPFVIFSGILLLFFSIILRAVLERREEEKKQALNSIWEILVPASNKANDFTYEHHKEWDEFVKSLAGGLTIMKTSKGEWISPNGVLYVDRMIPVKIICNSATIEQIAAFTIKHYKQEAVTFYKVGDEVRIYYKHDLKK